MMRIMARLGIVKPNGRYIAQKLIVMSGLFGEGSHGDQEINSSQR